MTAPRGTGRSVRATSDTPTTGDEPRQSPGTQQRRQNPETDAIKFFDTTVIKIDAQGREVMSDHLAPGERLRRDETDRYTYNRPTETDAARAKAANTDDDN